MGVVLIGGDEKLFASLSPGVARLGHEAVHAAEPARVLALCRSTPPPALVVLSLRVAKGAGPDVLAELAPQRAKGLPVAVLLPANRANDAPALLAAGAAEVFQSPLRLSVFIDGARRAMGLPACAAPPAAAAPAAKPDEPKPAAQRPAEPKPPEPRPAAETPKAAEAKAIDAAPPPAPAAAAEAPKPAPAAEAAPAPVSRLTDDIFETKLWPAQKPALEPLLAALVLRNVNPAAEVPGDAAALADVARQLNSVEVRVLRLLAERAHLVDADGRPLAKEAQPPSSSEAVTEPPHPAASDEPPAPDAGTQDIFREIARGVRVRSEDVEPLAAGLAHRVRVRSLAAELERLQADETSLQVNDGAFAEMTREMQESLERLSPVVENAMRSKDADLLRASGASRTALQRALHELGNLSRRARGEIEKPLDLGIGADESGPAEPAKHKRRSIGRVIIQSTQQVARRLADPRAVWALGFIAALTLFVHGVVLGSWTKSGDTKVVTPPAGAKEVVATSQALKVVVQPGFQLDRDAAKLAKGIDVDGRPVLFFDANNVPIGALRHGQVLHFTAPPPPPAPPAVPPQP